VLGEHVLVEVVEDPVAHVADVGARRLGGDRAASNAVVADAETLIKQAGESTPVDTKKIHAAKDKLKEAIRIDPQNDAAYVDLGFCYGVLRDGTTATDMYMKATQLNPSADNFIELADVYLRVGDAQDALLAANAWPHMDLIEEIGTDQARSSRVSLMPAVSEAS